MSVETLQRTCVLCPNPISFDCASKRHCEKHHELYKDVTN